MISLLAIACCLFSAGEVAAPVDDAISYREIRNRIFVPVSINDQGPYTFLVDLSSPFAIVDEAAAEKAGLTPLPESKVEMPDATGNFVTAHAAEASLKAGGRSIEGGPCIVAPLDALTDWMGVPVHGTISLAHLGSVVAVDFAQQTISWPASPPSNPNAAALTFLDGNWHVKTLLNGAVAADSVVDLGYGGVSAMPEAWARDRGLLQLGAKRVVIEWGDAAPPLAPTGQVQLRSIRIGSFQYDNVWVDLVAAGAYPRLGVKAFAGTRTVWDFQGGALYVEGEPSPEVALPTLAGYGITLGRHDGSTWRIGVAMPSPASRAGLRGGESLLSVAGEDMTTAGYGEALEALRATSAAAKTMVFEQDGEPITLELSPESLR